MSFLWSKMDKKAYLSVFRGIILGITHELLRTGMDFDEINNFLKRVGKRTAEVIYVNVLEHIVPAENIDTFIENLRKVHKRFVGIELDRVSLCLNSKRRSLLLSISFRSPICEGFIAPNPSLRIGSLLAGIYEWIVDQRKEFFGAFDVKVYEDKCQSLGDDYDEYIFEFKLRLKKYEELKKRYELDKWIIK